MKRRLALLFVITGLMIVGCGEKESVLVPEISVQEEVTENDITEENVQEPQQEEEAEKPQQEEEAEQPQQEEEVQETVEENNLFAEFADLEFYFLSGAGGWRTFLRIEEDGRFWGQFSDSEMGAVGDDYPNGMYYLSDFEGQFSAPVKVNDYTYTMKIEEISYQKEVDTEEIIDGILYYYCDAYGLTGAEELLIYLPGAPFQQLPESYRMWVGIGMNDEETTELPFYGIYNVTEENGFYSQNVSNQTEEMIESTKRLSATLKASLQNDSLSQQEMNMKAGYLYEIWDEALNSIWLELKHNLPEEEFSKLLSEQRSWNSEKEKAMEEAGKEVEGGSMYPLVVNMEAAELTEARVYELYKLLK